jgi:hypothetical protein
MGLFVGGFLMFGLAAPAAAQAKVDFAGGYQYLDFLETGESSVPAGWGASIAVGNGWIKAVGDIGGNHKNGGSLYTYQGGVEFSGTGKRVVPFARVLTGLAQSYDGEGDTFSAFVFTPEAGVKFMANNHVGAHVSVGFPILMKDGDYQQSMRIFAGIVIRH